MIPPCRSYQVEQLERARAVIRDLRASKRGAGVLLCAPTGSGKTRMAIEIALGARARGGEVLWLAPRVELVDQPLRRLLEYGVTDVQAIRPGGRIAGDPCAKIRIAAIQTLLASGQRPSADVLVLDEARHYAAAEWSRVATSYPDAVRVGLDATPVRADGTSLRDLFDVLVPGPTVRELQAAGHLVPMVLYAPLKEQRGLASTPLEAYEQRCEGRRAVVFAPNVATSKRWAAEFCCAGIPAMHVDGETDEHVRADALRRLASGQLRVLTNVALFAEGVDVPEVECVIVARGVASEAAWIQMLGRALRPSVTTGKTRAIGVDLRGAVHRFGLVDAERTWHLDGEPVRRAEAVPGVRQCPACLAWGAAGQPCAGCGATLPPPPPPRMTRAELEEIRRSKLKREGAGWELWCEIVRDVRAKGHKAQSAFFRYRSRTGHAPRWRVDDVPAVEVSA